MSSRSRFLLSLVATLSLATLASADSASVSSSFLHNADSGYFATNSTAPHASSENWSIQPNRLLVGKNTTTTTFNFQGNRHGTIAGRNGNWLVGQSNAPGGSGTPLTTPEPGSLMLLSTGLIGIAGTLRRKLRRS